MSRAIGEITLFYNDHFLEQRKYRCYADRRNIIEAWSKKYRPQWSRCVLLINPELESEMTHSDGTNLRLRGYKEPSYRFKGKALPTVRNPLKNYKYNAVSPEKII